MSIETTYTETIEVSGCDGCPFLYEYYNHRDGYDYSRCCAQKKEEHNQYKLFNTCPLKTKKLIIKFKEIDTQPTI